MASSSDTHFDFIVIGGGSAGYAAARTVRETRERVAIVDDGPDLGGLCILRGCMPSKTLIYSAEVLHLAQKPTKFGLNIPEAQVDMPALRQRKDAMVSEFAEYRVEQLESDRFTLWRERATFLDAQTIELSPSGQRLTADAFLIATGSVASWPEVPGLQDVDAWTSDDVLALDFLPESVIVLGGGVVACELTQYLSRVGSQVTQIQRSPHLLKEGTPESSAVVEQAFRDEGISLYTGTALQKIEKTAQGVRVTFVQDGETKTAEAAHLFNALGRRPNVSGLGLEAAGVTLNDKGQIAVNDQQQTANPRIYAAGDVAGPYEIVHIAIMQGEVAGFHATGRAAEPVNYATRSSVVFTDPQIATVGDLPAELRAQGIELVEADYPFDDHGKSILMEAKYGYVKCWADKATGKLLGAECVGKDAGELIHAMAVAVSLEATPAQLLKVHWYHPTLAEIWSYPLEDLADELSQ